MDSRSEMFNAEFVHMTEKFIEHIEKEACEVTLFLIQISRSKRLCTLLYVRIPSGLRSMSSNFFISYARKEPTDKE